MHRMYFEVQFISLQNIVRIMMILLVQHTILAIHMFSSIVLWHSLPIQIASCMGDWFCIQLPCRALFALPCFLFVCLHRHVLSGEILHRLRKKCGALISLDAVVLASHRARMNKEWAQITGSRVKQKWSSYHYYLMPSDGLICLYAYYLFEELFACSDTAHHTAPIYVHKTGVCEEEKKTCSRTPSNRFGGSHTETISGRFRVKYSQLHVFAPNHSLSFCIFMQFMCACVCEVFSVMIWIWDAMHVSCICAQLLHVHECFVVVVFSSHHSQLVLSKLNQA